MENSKQPAFPASASWRDESPEIIQVAQEGLTKREYIAIKVLQSLVVSANHRRQSIWSRLLDLLGYRFGEVYFAYNQEHACKCALETADEMLKQLESK